AIYEIVAAGSTVVAGAGNDNLNVANFSPANCNGVITVAATNIDGSKASYSNYGTAIEVAAPGGETLPTLSNGVLSTLNDGTTVPGNDDYVFYQGTSMAAPHVSGIASLMLSVNPTLIPTQVSQIVQDTATPFPTGTPGTDCTASTCGEGIIDAAAAVGAAINACCIEPALQILRTPPGDDQPTYDWVCGMQYTWFQVYALNLSTGQVYDSGWVNSTDNFWVQPPNQLETGYHQAWVRVYDPQCGVSEWSALVNFTVGNCASKPTLTVSQTAPASDEQPRYQWDAGANAQWAYYWVYVVNSSTGQVYDSGWVNSTDNFWDQLVQLPWGNYQAFVQVYHPQCGVSGWSDPVNFTVGNCAAKPVLQPIPDGDDQPTYDWSSTTGAWDYFQVYVLNRSTGATYSSGWGLGPDSTWTQPYTLPVGDYRAWVQVYHPDCGISELSDPVDWTLPYAAGRFFNNVLCNGGFNATLYIDGVSLTSFSGNWAGCAVVAPGLYTATVSASTACGPIYGSVRVALFADTVYDIVLDYDPGLGPFVWGIERPGNCNTPLPFSLDTSGKTLMKIPTESKILMEIPTESQGFSRAR
ncbi:MAG: S8 family serine peptidase, partial [Planctomycetota bacterium]